jgi:hypothetical protein
VTAGRPATDVDGSRRRTLRLVTGAAMVVGAVAIALTAFIHLHVWMGGYLNIPTIGWMFLVQFIVGFVLAIVVALWHRLLVALAGMGFLAATAGGLLVFLNFTLFGFAESLGNPYVGASLVVEVVGVVVLGIAAGLMLWSRRSA